MFCCPPAMDPPPPRNTTQRHRWLDLLLRNPAPPLLALGAAGTLALGEPAQAVMLLVLAAVLVGIDAALHS